MPERKASIINQNNQVFSEKSMYLVSRAKTALKNPMPLYLDYPTWSMKSAVLSFQLGNNNITHNTEL